MVRTAWDSLASHKLRSGLTTLGVIFGVAAVIGMASIGEGAKREALKQIQIMGASNILIDYTGVIQRRDDEDVKSKNPRGITIADADGLREIILEADYVVPQRMRELIVRSSIEEANLNIVATTPAYFPAQNLKFSQGRTFTWLDERDSRLVCVLGGGANRDLFPLGSAMGEKIKIEGEILVVVGVLENQMVGSEIEGFEVRDRNKDVYISLVSAMKRFPPEFGESHLHRITVQIPDVENLPDYANVIERNLRRRHYGEDDFDVIVPEELLRQHQKTQSIFNIVMGTIASISLLVGGIGIMNIMLASVLERTTEIGVRRALGAKQHDIAQQFLIEATLLSLFGGLVGVIIGILLAIGISMFAEWETAVSMWSIFLAVGVSAAVGIGFGFLPAQRAARLDPIVALRSD